LSKNKTITIIANLFNLPSFIRFLRPSVPNLSQKDSSLSPVLGVTGLGDLDLGEVIAN